MDLELSAQEQIRHALVVHQIAQRLAHLRLRQDRIAHVDLEIDQGRLRIGLDHDVLIALEAGDLVGAQVARDVGIALLDQEPLRAGLGHVPDDHALHRRRAVARVWASRTTLSLGFQLRSENGPEPAELVFSHS